MTDAKFEVGRANGKSNQQVIAELVAHRESGTVFTFSELGAVLAEGSDREFDRQAIQQCVRLANKRLLREHRRLLVSVKNVGYAIAHPKDQAAIAMGRNRKSSVQLKWAMDTLSNVRLEEMTETQRVIHLAQQSVNSELIQQHQRILRRQHDHAKLIAGLTHRVEQVEAAVATAKA